VLREHGATLLGRVALASGCLRRGTFEGFPDGYFVAQEPVFIWGFGFDQVEGVGEQLSWLTESSAVKLALDAFFGDGVEGDGHG
jgi:hypothetical protein